MTEDPYLAKIAKQIETEIGLVIEEWQFGFLYKNIEKRLKQLDLSSLSQYWQRLRADKFQNPEFQVLINRVTNNETFFFRIPQQYVLIQKRLLPNIREVKKEKSLKIWSAGCSSGEEIYTMAMVLKSEEELWNGWKIKLLATDISETILDKARQGVYSQRSIQFVPQNLKQRFFQKEALGCFQLTEDIRKMVTFGYHNLAERESEKENPIHEDLVDIDVIFFRNVMIYFKFETIKKVIKDFSKRISNEGFLLLGPAETLWKVSSRFKPEMWGESTVYRPEQFEGGQSNLPETKPELKKTRKDTKSTTLRKPFDMEAFVKARKEREKENESPVGADVRPGATAGVKDKIKADTKADIEVDVKADTIVEARDNEPKSFQQELWEIKAMMDRGNWDEALAKAQNILSSYPDSPEINFILALIFDQRGDVENGLLFCRRVLYLKRDLLFPRLIYARLLRRDQKNEESLFQYREIMRRYLQGKIDSLELQDEIIPFNNQRVFFEAKRMLEKG